MAEDLKMFSSSLKEYLTNVHTDEHNTPTNNLSKYNNLKIYMEPQRYKIPHFWVSFNIVAACFTLDSIEKVAGNIGIDDKYIIAWANRPNIKGELKKHWDDLIKVIKNKDDYEFNNIIQIDDDEFVYISDIITDIDSKLIKKILKRKFKNTKKLKVLKIKLKNFRVKILKLIER